jgi:serine protease AprX
VESIETDTVCHATRASAEAAFGVTQAVADFGLTGDGDGDMTSYSAQDHTIAIVDTGIDEGHQDFDGGKVLYWHDYVNGGAEPYDDEGHGTHVASIAAGAINAEGVGGVAPGAALVALKVLDSEGGGPASVIIQAVDWCITHRAEYGIQVINMSLGGDEASAGTDALSRAVDRAVAAGIVVCVAGGNSGPDLATTGSPAAARGAITVGNIADPGEGGFFLDPHSSRGPTADGRVKPDLCAPGYQILAARANTRDQYVRATGTSMASPFVAGTAALMRQANPSLSPEQIKAILKETAVPFGLVPSGETENNDYGAGRMDGFAALAEAAGKTGAGPTVPAHLFSSGHLSEQEATESWEITVTDTQFPVAITLLIYTAETDFDFTVYDPAGRMLGVATGNTREQVGAFRPTQTGTYRVVVHPVAEMGEAFVSGDFSLDVSAGAAMRLTPGE